LISSAKHGLAPTHPESGQNVYGGKLTVSRDNGFDEYSMRLSRSLAARMRSRPNSVLLRACSEDQKEDWWEWHEWHTQSIESGRRFGAARQY